jgi:methyl-accepting chemotaxis protein
MVSEADIEKFLEKLPEVIKKNPELAYKFYRVLKEEFATIAALRDFMEQSNRQFQELLQSVKEGFKRMDERFEAVDKRFEAIDKRFEASDKRFEALINEMNQRFDAVDKRFEASDKRFEALINEMNQRFDAVDKRFDVIATELMKIKVGIGTLGRKAGDEASIFLRWRKRASMMS